MRMTDNRSSLNWAHHCSAAEVKNKHTAVFLLHTPVGWVMVHLGVKRCCRCVCVFVCRLQQTFGAILNTLKLHSLQPDTECTYRCVGGHTHAHHHMQPHSLFRQEYTHDHYQTYKCAQMYTHSHVRHELNTHTHTCSLSSLLTLMQNERRLRQPTLSPAVTTAG